MTGTKLLLSIAAIAIAAFADALSSQVNAQQTGRADVSIGESDLGGDLVCSVSKGAHADKVIASPGPGELAADGLVDQVLGRGWQLAVPGDRDPHQVARLV